MLCFDSGVTNDIVGSGVGGEGGCTSDDKDGEEGEEEAIHHCSGGGGEVRNWSVVSRY